MALYSGRPLPLASLLFTFFTNRENFRLTSGHSRHQADLDGA